MSTTYSPQQPTPTLLQPSSTLVNISDDADIRLIHVLAPGTPNPTSFENDCATAIKNGDAAQLLRTVIDNGAIAGLLSSKGGGGGSNNKGSSSSSSLYTVDEAVSAFSLLTVYLDRVGDATVEKELCEALAESVVVVSSSSDVDDESLGKKQSAMIAALFNLRTDGNEKVKLLTKIVDLANVSALCPGGESATTTTTTPLADVLDVVNLKSSLALWGSSNNDTTRAIDNVNLRGLYAAVSKGMDRVLAKLLAKDEEGQDNNKTTVLKVKAAKERKQAYMLLFLETYNEESQLDNDATTIAHEASIYAIRDPIALFTTQRGILSLPAITSLSKSQPALYDLLKIIMEGKLQDYRDFTAMPDKVSVFASCGLDEEACMKNMCLLSLVSLAGEHEEIPYGAIASTLSIEENEVEQWVIRAVSSGLMEAKMDQLRKVVLVERCAVRQFGIKEWTALKVRLDKWKANVRGVLDALKKSGAIGPDGQ